MTDIDQGDAGEDGGFGERRKRGEGSRGRKKKEGEACQRLASPPP